MPQSPQWVLLARILRPQGRKGEVLAELFTDFPERFKDHPAVWLAPNGFVESSVGAPVQAEVKGHWLPLGRNAGRIVLHFAGADSINEAEKLSDQEVIVPMSERVPLEEDAAYVSDLIGCTVYDGETALGTIEDVEFPATADGSRRLGDAAPLLTLASRDGAELLIPFAKAYLVEIDTQSKAIRMRLPEGLADLNARPAVQKQRAAEPE